MAHRILVGWTSSENDDRAQYTPVDLAGVEQCSDAIVFKVSKPKGDPANLLLIRLLSASVGPLLTLALW
jgi:hypothetical protein